MVLPFADRAAFSFGGVWDRPAGFSRLLAGADWPGSPASPADVDDFT